MKPMRIILITTALILILSDASIITSSLSPTETNDNPSVKYCQTTRSSEITIPIDDNYEVADNVTVYNGQVKLFNNPSVDWAIEDGYRIYGDVDSPYIVQLSDGSYRMYYCHGSTSGTYGFDPSGIKSAVSSNGIDWAIEDGYRIYGDVDSPYIVQLSNGSYRMYYCHGSTSGTYGFDPSGIKSAVSSNGIDWAIEDGYRIYGDVDSPHIVQLSNGSYRMYYCHGSTSGTYGFDPSGIKSAVSLNFEYALFGMLISTTQDIGDSYSYFSIYWDSVTPENTDIKFQLRTAQSETELYTTNFVGYDGTPDTYYTSSGQSIWSGHNGDQWFQFKAYLSTTNTSRTPVLYNVTIEYNGAPSASNLMIIPSNPKTGDDLIASYEYSDIDLDPEYGSEIRWYKDDLLQSAYNDQTEIPSTATTKGEQWYFTVRPKDGIDFGELKTSPVVTISNTAPTKPIGLIPSNETIDLGVETTVSASWSPSTDLDSTDTITYNVYGDLNNPNPTTLVEEDSIDATTTLTGLIDDGVYFWKVVASDGTDTVESDVALFTVNKNSPPIVTLTSPTNGETIASSTLELSWSVDDPDEDFPIYYNVY
jgi:hypothetical protein